MTPSPIMVRAALLLAALGWLAASTPAQAQVTPMPDFQLVDQNPNSPRYRGTVSPRDYRLQISAYYFGAAG
ncbi:MAG: hypothetical protein IT580_17100 [Verrucomicrobiales bacterium]|nr:hypothetical protein [Verrucomicrobiales bacterium]